MTGIEGAKGAVPDALLDAEDVAAPEPPRSYLVDGEQVHYAFLLEKIRGTVAATQKGWHDGDKLGVLTDRRVLLFHDADSEPVSLGYQTLDVSGGTGGLSLGSDFVLEHPEGTFKLRPATETHNLPEASNPAEYGGYAGIDEYIEFLQRWVDVAEQAESDTRQLWDRVKDLREEAGEADPVTAIELYGEAHDAAEEAAEAARRFHGPEPGKFEEVASRLRRDTRERLESLLESYGEASDAGRHGEAAETAGRVLAALDAAPIEAAERDDHRVDLREKRMASTVRARDARAAADLALEAFDGPPDDPPDPVGPVVDALLAVAEDDQGAVADVVALLVPELARNADPYLVTTLETLQEQDPALFDAVPPADVTGLLHESATETREVACRLLGHLGTADHLDALRELTDDDEYRVRVAALEAMNAISEREEVPLGDADREQMQTVNVEYHGEGDVVAGDYTDNSTAVEDSVVNRSDVGQGDGASASDDDDGPAFCPSCGSEFAEYEAPAFCPSCGFEL